MAPRLKWALWLAAWVGVFIAMITSKPAYVLTAPLFPLGLIAAFPNGEGKSIVAWMIGIPAVLFGWIFYGLLSIAMARAKRSWVFILMYVLFCAALALNVVGCRRTLQAVQQLH
jgi:hypothetical protein